jgi:hypothetical protein
VTTQRTIDAMTGKVQIQAQVWTPGNALIAFLASDGGIDSHPLPLIRPRGDQGAELMSEDEPITNDRVTDAGLPIPMSVRTTEPNGKDLEQDFPVDRFWHGEVDVFEGPGAGETDSRRGGRAQEAASTAGLTVSMSLSMVSRS